MERRTRRHHTLSAAASIPDHLLRRSTPLLNAKTGHYPRSYSITLSARSKNVCWIVRPRAVAVPPRAGSDQGHSAVLPRVNMRVHRAALALGGSWIRFLYQAGMIHRGTSSKSSSSDKLSTGGDGHVDVAGNCCCGVDCVWIDRGRIGPLA
jgi:hypothetical protein